MKLQGIIRLVAIFGALAVLFYIAKESLISQSIPSLQEYITSSTSSTYDESLATTTSEQVLGTSSVSVASSSEYTILHAPLGDIRVMTARTPSARERGLSGRDLLAPDEGLLFIFPRADVPGFWMKDMKFPIDIVWITPSRKVVSVDESIMPETYPKTYYPPSKIQFVLEVNAGYAKKFGIREGTTVVF